MSPSGAEQLWNEMRFSVVCCLVGTAQPGLGTKWLLVSYVCEEDGYGG